MSIPYATGGKVWSIPTKKSGHPSKSAIDTYGRFVYSLFAAIGAVLTFSLIILLTTLNPVEMLNINFGTSSTPSASSGYSYNNTLSLAQSLSMIIPTLSSISFFFFAFQAHSAHIGKKVVIALITLASICSFVCASFFINLASPANNEASSIQWMQERYGFTASNNESASSLTDGTFLYDPSTKIIASVKKSHDAFYLYDLNGAELPVVAK